MFVRVAMARPLRTRNKTGAVLESCRPLQPRPCSALAPRGVWTAFGMGWDGRLGKQPRHALCFPIAGQVPIASCKLRPCSPESCETFSQPLSDFDPEGDIGARCRTSVDCRNRSFFSCAGGGGIGCTQPCLILPTIRAGSTSEMTQVD
jgi:hypothetical protein